MLKTALSEGRRFCAQRTSWQMGILSGGTSPKEGIPTRPARPKFGVELSQVAKSAAGSRDRMEVHWRVGAITSVTLPAP
jgi:hypothetical protein